MAGTQAKQKKPFYKDLFVQVVIAIIVGIALGHWYPATATSMKPLGDIFINLIKMMIAPIIFCTLVSGVAGMGSMKQVGRVGVKALLCFEVITTLALVIGLVLVEFWQPGSSMHINEASASGTDVGAIKQKVEHTEMATFGDFVMHMIPTTLLSAFSSGDTLQVLLVAILFAWSQCPRSVRSGKNMLSFIDMLSRILFRMMDLITLLAPIGAFGAIGLCGGQIRPVQSLKDLGELLGIFYLTCAVFIALVLAPLMRFYCKPQHAGNSCVISRKSYFIVLGTSSSESVLPRLMEKLEKMGVSASDRRHGRTCRLFLQSRRFIHLFHDGSHCLLSIATHTHITLGQELWLLGVLLIASKGAAGVSGSAFIVMAATLSSMKIIDRRKCSTVGLAFIYGIDRFMSTGRAITNLIGNGITPLLW